MRIEIENPMVLPRFIPPYREPHTRSGPACCCCDRQAVYEVDGDPHCKPCMYDAIDTDIEVKVKKI